MNFKRLVSYLPVVATLFLAKVGATPPEGYLRFIEVRFAYEPYEGENPIYMFGESLQAGVANIERMFLLSSSALYTLSNAEEGLPNLNLWYIIELKDSVDDESSFLSQVLEQENVAVAIFMPDISPPTAIRRRHLDDTPTPDYEPQQQYLDAAPVGIDARYIWTIPGGEGDGVTVYDVERVWTQDHEDLFAAAGATPLVRPGWVGWEGRTYSPLKSDEKHGAAVIGVIIGSANAFGVTGIVPNANIGLVEEWARPSPTSRKQYVVPDGITLAVNDGSPGDIILLEIQVTVCGDLPRGPAGKFRICPLDIYKLHLQVLLYTADCSSLFSIFSTSFRMGPSCF